MPPILDKGEEDPSKWDSLHGKIGTCTNNLYELFLQYYPSKIDLLWPPFDKDNRLRGLVEIFGGETSGDWLIFLKNHPLAFCPGHPSTKKLTTILSVSKL